MLLCLVGWHSAARPADKLILNSFTHQTGVGAVIHPHQNLVGDTSLEPQMPWFQSKSSGFATIKLMKFSRQLSESLLVQTLHLCLQDLLPTSAYQSYLLLSTYLQASCQIFQSKHITRASRTHSQPQPVEISSMLISRQVVGVSNVQIPHLCLQDLLPTSACRDALTHKQKQCHRAIS